MTTGLVAVRRNLTPGAVFFRQIGQEVQYSLDRVTWWTAFILESGTIMTPAVQAAAENMTVNQFIAFVQAQYQGSTTVANLSQTLNAPTGRMHQNICAAAQSLAATFAAIVNVHAEDEVDNELSLLASAALIVEYALEIAKRRFGLAGLALKWINRVIWGARAVEAASTFYEYLNTVPDLTDCDIDEMACAIYRAIENGAGDKSIVAGALINHFDFNAASACGTSNMTTAITEWFSMWIYEWPELWTAFLTGLTDAEITSCDCGGCYIKQAIECNINTYTGGYPTGYPLLNGSVRTIPARTWASPGNEKQLSLRYYLPAGQTGGQIDSVTIWYVTVAYLYQSGLAAWSTQPAVTLVLGGPGATVTRHILYNQLPAFNGPQKVTFDVSDTNLYLGVSYIDMRHIINRTANSSVNDISTDTAMIQFEYCRR